MKKHQHTAFFLPCLPEQLLGLLPGVDAQSCGVQGGDGCGDRGVEVKPLQHHPLRLLAANQILAHLQEAQAAREHALNIISF